MIEEISHSDLLYGVLLNLGWKSSDISRQKQIYIKKGGIDLSFFLKTINHEPYTEIVIFEPKGFQLPSKKNFYQYYLDHNYVIHVLIDYVKDKFQFEPPILLIDSNKAFLIDSSKYEVILYCDSKKEQIDNLYPLLEKRKVLHGLTDLFHGKSYVSHGRELFEWISLWCTEFGSRLNIPKFAIEQFIKNIIFLRVFEILFPEEIPKMKFSNFLQPDNYFDSDIYHPTEMSVKAIERTIFYLNNQRGIDFFNISFMKEIFNKIKTNKYHIILWKFLSEINLLSLNKFVFESLSRAFLSESDFHKKLKNKYSDSDIDIEKEMMHEEIYIYKPIIIDLEQVGFSSMLDIFEKLSKYWVEYNNRIIIEMRRTGIKCLNLDMFMDFPKHVSKNGFIKNIFAFVIDYCFRIKADNIENKNLAEYLMMLKILFLMKNYKIDINIFPSLKNIWV